MSARLYRRAFFCFYISMRICMFTVIFPPAIGGPATQCFNLCRALLAKGIEPVVVTYGKEFSKTESLGYPVYTFKRFYGLGFLDRLIRWLIFPFYIFKILRKEKIQILHCHSVNMLSFAAAAVAKAMGIPRVLKFAGDWVWETLSAKKLREENFEKIYRMSLYSRLLTFIEKAGLRLFDVIWTPSEFRRQNVKYLLGDDKKTIIIPNALLFSDSGAAGKKAGQRIFIVSANRFIPHKRVPWLVEAYAAVADSRTKLILIGGGDSEQVALVKETVDRLGLAGSVELTGILSSEKVYKIFREASFYVSASLEEGLPNVFIEAMHYGLPIVASDVGGCREMIIEGQTGFLVAPDDRRAFEERMKILINDAALRERFAGSAFNRSKLFDLEKTIGDFIKMYRDLIK